MRGFTVTDLIFYSCLLLTIHTHYFLNTQTLIVNHSIPLTVTLSHFKIPIYQAVLQFLLLFQNLAVKDLSFKQYSSLSELFAPKSEVFMLGWPHYGCMGEVTHLLHSTFRSHHSLLLYCKTINFRCHLISEIS